MSLLTSSLASVQMVPSMQPRKASTSEHILPTCQSVRELVQPIPSTAPHTETATRLSYLSQYFYIAISERNMDTVTAMARAHLTPAFESRVDNYVSAPNIQDYLRNIEHMVTSFPQMQLECMRINTHVDEERGYALVYASFVIRGRPTEVRRVSMTVGEWARRKEQWVCLRCTMLRGLHLGIMDELDNDGA